MKYDMPALTEQQREESIIECEHILAHQDSYKGWLINMAKITLVALTAEVRGSLIQSVNPNTGNIAIFYRERGINSISPEEIAEWEMSELDHFYTAPPVPAMKLPEGKPDWECEDGQDIDSMEPSDVYAVGKDDGFNKCLTEVKRLNGVKDA